MSAADYTIRQGDTGPAFQQQLSYSDGSVVNLTGATVQFVMRSLTSASPVAITGTIDTGNPSQGIVTYTPSAADTAIPGEYMANWLVTFPTGQVMSFPTVGYLWVSVEENLTTPGGQQLVSLPDVKDHMNIPASSRVTDNKLLSWIASATVMIEAITGPILVRTIEEWHAGGQVFIRLRRRPSTALGTTPVLNLLACSEYLGPVEWNLAIVPTPDLGQIYSCMLDSRFGRVVRRTAGGGVQPFPVSGGGQDVHVVYQAGQASVPPNVYDAAVECVRVWYETTMAVGRGSRSRADEGDTGPQLGMAMPPSARRLLGPMRKAPAVA